MKQVLTLLLSIFLLVPSSIFAQEETDGMRNQMPRFPGCEEMEGTNQEKKECAEKRMFEFLSSNLKYPDEARKKGTEGMVLIRFVIKKDGSIADAQIINDLENGCGDEALRLVQSMPNWIPGKQRGVPTNVQFNLPISFRLSKLKKKQQKNRGRG